MRIFFTAASLAWLLSACNDPNVVKLHVPPPHPPTEAEAIELPLEVSLTYVQPAPAPWDQWVGQAMVDMAAPEAGLPEAPATGDLGDGFDDLGCLASLAGGWNVDDVGALSMNLADDGGSSITLSGVLQVKSRRTDDGAIESRLTGSGTWTVVLGPNAEPDDFQGGLTGAWTTEEPALLTADPAPREPRIRVLLIADGDVALDVTGPVSKVLP